MISVYTDADYFAAYKQKQRTFAGFWGMTVAYALICIAMLVYHICLPYGASEGFIPKLVTYVATGIYFIVMFPYVSIKLRRIRKYYKVLFFISEGRKMEESNYFYTFREKSLQKDHIDVRGCVFETWNKKHHEWQEREVYSDIEKPLPEFESGDYARYISQSNFLVQYEILEKHAYEFSEYEEDEDEENEGVAEDTQEEIVENNEGEEA